MKRRFEDSSPITESPIMGAGVSSSDMNEGEDISNKNNGIVFGAKDFTNEEHGSMQRLLEQKIPVEYLSTRQGCGRGLLYNYYYHDLMIIILLFNLFYLFCFDKKVNLHILKVGEQLKLQTVFLDLMDGHQKL